MGCRPPSTLLVALLAGCLLIPASTRLRGDSPLLQVDTAFVTQDTTGRGWIIGNDLIQYSYGQQGTAFGVRAITDAVTGRDWHQNNSPDVAVTINGQTIVVGSSATVFDHADTTEWWGGVRLNLTYRAPSTGVEITRSYACYPGSSAIETWLTLRAATGRSVTLSSLNGFAFTVKNGTMRWLRGLQVPADQGGSFSLAKTNVDDGQTFEIGSDTRSSEMAVPFFSVMAEDAVQDDPSAWSPEFFGTYLWSGSWKFTARRQGGVLSVQLGLPQFQTDLGGGATLETPHAVFGLTNPTLPAVSLALRMLTQNGIRHGRPLRADVTYDTWFTYGTLINEASMQAEMQFAAQMGIEQFVIDAGWWAGINLDDSSDFTRGLGNWQVDSDRFPNGLGALTDYAHQLGMRFGVWVEPERVDLQTVDQDGLAKERFLATSDGRYASGEANSVAAAAQICLADSEARAWLTTKLHDFLDAVHPDYLKWDNNYWINCNRRSHGHGDQDGNFQHMRGLMSILDELRTSYPDMDIENSASGGNRLSLGWLAYTDAGWMDDHSSPSVHVRHNLDGLSTLFPPAYLFSYAMGDVTEEFIDTPSADLLNLLRSRMAGLMGGTWSASSMSEGTRTMVGQQLGLYKAIRPILRDSGAVLLTPQVTTYPDSPWWGWDAVQLANPSTGDAVVLAFETDDAADTFIAKPRALNRDANYEVESADYGILGTVSGADLMDQGVELGHSDLTHSHVLIFRVK